MQIKFKGVASAGRDAYFRPAGRVPHLQLNLNMSTSSAATDIGTDGAAIEKQPIERYVAPAMPSLVGLPRAALGEALTTAGVAPQQLRMRVQQVWHWLYVRGVRDIDEMTSVSKELRAELKRRFTLDRPDVAAEQISSRRHPQVAHCLAGRTRRPAA